MEDGAEISIYIMAMEGGPRKIGISNNVERRIWGIQNGCPGDLTIEFKRLIPKQHARKIESSVHWLLRDKNIVREWFNVSREDAMEAINHCIDNFHSIVTGKKPKKSRKCRRNSIPVTEDILRQRHERRKHLDRERQRRRRLKRGVRPQEQSLSRTKPWEKMEISRRTWFRRKKSPGISRRTWERWRKKNRELTSQGDLFPNTDPPIQSG